MSLCGWRRCRMIPVRERVLENGIGRGSLDGPALRDGESHFRRLLEKLPAGAYTCDAEGLITYYNRHAVQLWGRAPKLNDPIDRFCGSFKLFSTDGTPIAHDRCWMALALKQDKEFNKREIVIERPDGERLTALAHANPIHDESGRLVGAVNVLVDITDRKHAEENLRRQEEVFRSLSASSPVGIFMTDLDGRCTYTNPRCQAICGFTFEEGLGDGWTRFVHPEDRERILADWNACARDGREYSRELRFQSVRSGMRWAHLRYSPMLAETGEPRGYVGTVEDVTEQKRAQQALLEMRQAERRRIARDLHDVVLQDLAGALQGLQATRAELAVSDTQIGLNQEIDALRRAVDGLRNAIYDLRFEKEQPFVRAVESLVEFNRQLLPESRIGLSISGGIPELRGRVGVELLRVLQEALANVRRHSGARRVEVGLASRGTGLRATVYDDGRGFDPASTRKGFGLPGMEERITALGGELTIESGPGRGASVEIEIPTPETYPTP